MLRQQSDRIIRFGRVVVHVLPLLFFGMLIVHDINPSGKRSVRYEIGGASSVISKLFPAHRLEGVQGRFQRLREEPVYFTVRYPHRYDSASVQVTVENPEGNAWQIGLATNGAEEWSYYFETPDETGAAVFDLRGAQVLDRSIRFALAVRGLSAESEFAVRDISVTLAREPIYNYLFLR